MGYLRNLLDVAVFVAMAVATVLLLQGIVAA